MCHRQGEASLVVEAVLVAAGSEAAGSAVGAEGSAALRTRTHN